ncbi:MAG: hypothetical protein K6G62_05955, partial [Eubacterium sp.]|nr:hypothetical protein [Eubacterium sp.]
MKYIRISVTVIVILVFGYIFLAEMILPFNSPRNGDICEMLPGDRWCLVKEDGTREPFLVPGRADGDIVLETVLPESIDKDVSVLCFRGMDMRVYIGDELRLDYSAKDYALFGDQSAEGYAMASVYPGDEGKKLTLYYGYNSGMVYDVYMGTRLGILADLFRQFGAELFLGLAVLLLGLISFIASCCYRIVHKKHLEMQELSLGVILGACWVISNSVFRQLFTRNMSVISNVPFLMVMVMPLPFLVFVDSLQQRRYEKALMAVGILEIVDFCVCACLFVAGKMSLVQAFPVAAGCAIVSIIVLFGTIFLDVKKHLISSYRIIAVGFLFLAVAAVVQIMMYQFAHNGVFSGFFMAVGLFCFLICAIIYTIKQIIGIRIAANEAVHANKAKDDFLANMSHEIRTPLNGILGMDEMIIRDTGERRIKNYALEIKSAGNTLLSLINDILDLSKIEAGRLEILPVDYDVASVLNDVINITRNRALEKNLQYNFAVSEELPSVLRGDEIRIRQVLLNIINNAIKYTREGRVDVEVSAEAGEIPEEIILVVKVADTGIGIREEDKDKLFMSFERLDEKKNRNIEGTGLGLHITYRLVEMMGGRIDVESKYGVGSTFTIVLPQPVVERE